MDHAVALYLSGKTIQEAATLAGVSPTPLGRELKSRRIEPRSRRHVLDMAEMIATYRSGVSESALAERYGVSRQVIKRRLSEASIPRRGIAESQQVRNASRTFQERQAQVAAANAAVRGVPQPHERQVAQALGRERRPRTASRYEKVFAGWLRKRGVNFVREKAVDVYNIDFAVGPIAVEILGGDWHSSGKKTALHDRRTPKILDSYAMLFIWSNRTDPMTEPVADYAVAFADEVRRDPSLIGEYRVIRRDAELLARGRLEDYQISGIPTTHQSPNTRS